MKVLSANAGLVVFPFLTAYVVREYADPNDSVRFLLLLVYVNTIGLLDLGTSRSILLRQDLPGRPRDLIALIAVVAGAAILMLRPSSSGISAAYISLGFIFWVHGLLKALLERDLKLRVEFWRKLAASLVTLTAALSLVAFGFNVSLLWFVLGSILVIVVFGKTTLQEYRKNKRFPKTNFVIALPSLLSFSVVNFDRVLVSHVFESSLASSYLFYSLVMQRGLGIFSSILPTYLKNDRLAWTEWGVPLLFAIGLVGVVTTYAIVVDGMTAQEGDFWLFILCCSYGVNLLTVPIIGGNLHRGKHGKLALNYIIQFLLMLGLWCLASGTLLGLASLVLFRSMIDFVFQWRMHIVGSRLL